MERDAGEQAKARERDDEEFETHGLLLCRKFRDREHAWRLRRMQVPTRLRYSPAPTRPVAEVTAMQVAIPLFPRFTALDGIGPYEVLQRIPEIDITFVGHQRGEVRSENGMLGITV